MNNPDSMVALNIVANAGYTDIIMDILRAEGARGATILNARGIGAAHQIFMGISLDTEKEIIITLVTADIAGRIMAEIRKSAGIETPTHAICYTMPVDKMTALNKTECKPD